MFAEGGDFFTIIVNYFEISRENLNNFRGRGGFFLVDFWKIVNYWIFRIGFPFT